MNHEAGIKNKPNGFTIIELIIVVSVIAILSSLGIAGFNNYNQAQSFQAAASDVVNTFNLAKSRALSQVKLTPVCAAADLGGYEVRIGLPNTYVLIIHCGLFEEYIQSENKRLPKNITFVSPASFFFPVLTGGVETAGQIQITGYGRTKTIIIDSVGGVKIQ